MHDEYTLRLLNTRFDVVVALDFKSVRRMKWARKISYRLPSKSCG